MSLRHEKSVTMLDIKNREYSPKNGLNKLEKAAMRRKECSISLIFRNK